MKKPMCMVVVAKLENEKPQGETIPYDELIKQWEAQ